MYDAGLECDKIIANYFKSKEYESADHKFNKHELSTAINILTSNIQEVIQNCPRDNAKKMLSYAIKKITEKEFLDSINNSKAYSSLQIIRKFYEYSGNTFQIYDEYKSTIRNCDDNALLFGELLSSLTVIAVNDAIKNMNKFYRKGIFSFQR